MCKTERLHYRVCSNFYGTMHGFITVTKWLHLQKLNLFFKTEAISPRVPGVDDDLVGVNNMTIENGNDINIILCIPCMNINVGHAHICQIMTENT